ncbi:MAG: hypothetical protein IT324_02725 [Anaerolineae bacterium]|nr:hypothetical protein [Anaerolineae bacterium]
MAFVIHQLLFDDETGEYFEQKAQQYLDELTRLFYDSPEGKALPGEDGWTRIMLDYAFGTIGMPLLELAKDDLEEILLDIFPASVSTPAESAPQIIAELQAFWRYIKREYALPNADDILRYLEEPSTLTDFREEMGNPNLYGPAKSIMMQGIQRGFDLNTPEGVDRWMATYNAKVTGGGPPLNLGAGRDWDDLDAGSSRAQRNKSAKKAKAKRKAEKASRKRNRRK